jgi:hypothetical protein
MKVERHEDGSVSAKCYRCGGWGRTKEKYGSAMKAAIKRTKSMVYSLPFTVEWPDDTTFDLSEFNRKARAKLYKCDITQKDVLAFDLGWSPRYERMFIPVHDVDDGELIGMQGRYYGDDPSYPRHITRYNRDSDLFAFLYPPYCGAEGPVVVVEDYLSGIRVARDAPVSMVVVLFGTEMGAKCLNRVANVPVSPIIVFLDDDNDTVKRKQILLKEKLEMVGRSDVVIHHSESKDPKDFTRDELCGIISSIRDEYL